MASVSTFYIPVGMPGLQARALPHLTFYLGSENSKLGPDSCTANTLGFFEMGSHCVVLAVLELIK